MDRIAMFQRYLQAHPKDRFALYGLALELKEAGRLEEAERAFAALLREHPTSGAGHYQLGLLHAEQGREDRARAAWEAGLEALAGATDPLARRSVVEIQGALDDLD